jgi:hypothetical protein
VSEPIYLGVSTIPVFRIECDHSTPVEGYCYLCALRARDLAKFRLGSPREHASTPPDENTQSR